MKGLFFLLALFSLNAFADVSCISNHSLFMPTINTKSNNSSDNDELEKFYLSLRANGKYMVVATNGPSILWPDGAHEVILSKFTNKTYFNEKENLTVEVYCLSNEVLLKFDGIPSIFLTKIE